MNEHQAAATIEQSPIKTARNVVALEAEDGGVLINLDTEQHYGVDPVAMRIWQLLAESGDVEQVIVHMLAEYEVEEAMLRQDVTPLLKHWQKIGLLEKAPGQRRVTLVSSVSRFTAAEGELQDEGKGRPSAPRHWFVKLWGKWRYRR